MAKIKVKIKDGQVSIEVDGMSGMGCEALTQALTESLGTIENINYKPEYLIALDGIEQTVSEE